MNEVRRDVPCPTCTANRPRLCDLHYQQGAEAFLQAVKHAIADPRTPDGVKATYEELLAQNRALAARVQAVERERDVMSNSREALVDVVKELRQQLAEAQGAKNQCVIELYQKLDKLDDTYNTLFAASHVQADELARVTAQLTQADQQVARLRESSNDLVEFFTQNHEDVGEELYGRVNGKDLTPSAKRLNEMLTEMQQALREKGAGKGA